MALKRVGASGRNDYGQLGDGTTQTRTSPVSTLDTLQFKQVSAGAYHSLAVDHAGNVWAWGLNNHGQLGDGTTQNRSSPVQVSGLSDVVAVAAGGAVDGYGLDTPTGFSLALKRDGTVWAWGTNAMGQLGDGTTTNRLTPVQVANLTDGAAIAAGAAHSLAVKQDGTVWGWGHNAYGELGDGSTTTRTLPVRMGTLSGALEVAAGGTRWDELADNNPLSYVGHSLVRKDDGTVWGTGLNSAGQLGDGSVTDRSSPVQMLGITSAVSIAAGSFHSLVARSDGVAVACGYNNVGQIGDGTTTNRSTVVVVQGLTDVANVSAGGHQIYKFDGVGNSFAACKNGEVYGWGSNQWGNLGDGTTTTRLTPVRWGTGSGHFSTVSAKGGHTLAIESRDALLFATVDGWPIRTKDFGSIVAGDTLGPIQVDLYNGSALATEAVTAGTLDVVPGQTIEISKTADPFIPDDPLTFSGPFAAGALVGSLYVRFRPTITSPGGQKSFKLRTRATPV